MIFDANLEFLILINSDIIYKYYYPKTGLLINKEILLKFSISLYGLHTIYSSKLKTLIIGAPLTDPYIFYFTKSDLTPQNPKAFLMTQIRRSSPQY